MLKAPQLARIRLVVDRGRDGSRQDLAREICRTFRWRRPNGTWAIRGARELLIRLEKAGALRLPAPRGVQGRPRREVVETAAALLSPADPAAVAELSARSGSGSTLLVRPIRADELLGWRAHMERFHYLGDAVLVGESLRYVAYLDGELVALLSWGSASLHNGPRDGHVGRDDATRKANLDLVVNNARFLVLPWGRRPHLASRVLAANLRRLSRDWEAAYGHRVVLAETFVDTSRFRGTCYRASNWLHVGETKGWSKSGSAYRFHGQPKAVWLYPLARAFKAQLCTVTDAGRPKEGMMVLDVEQLPLHGQGGLFEILCGMPDPRMRRGVRYLVEEKEADYVLTVKDNQGIVVTIGRNDDRWGRSQRNATSNSTTTPGGRQKCAFWTLTIMVFSMGRATRGGTGAEQKEQEEPAAERPGSMDASAPTVAIQERKALS